MTRKDYVALAEALAKVRDWLNSSDEDSSAEGDFGGHDALIQVEQGIADVLATDNPRFDRLRFLKACAGQAVQS